MYWCSCTLPAYKSLHLLARSSAHHQWHWTEFHIRQILHYYKVRFCNFVMLFTRKTLTIPCTRSCKFDAMSLCNPLHQLIIGSLQWCWKIFKCQALMHSVSIFIFYCRAEQTLVFSKVCTVYYSVGGHVQTHSHNYAQLCFVDRTQWHTWTLANTDEGWIKTWQILHTALLLLLPTLSEIFSALFQFCKLLHQASHFLASSWMFWLDTFSNRGAKASTCKQRKYPGQSWTTFSQPHVVFTSRDLSRFPPRFERIFPGKNLIQFLAKMMQDFRNFVLLNCILNFDAEQVDVKLQVTNVKNKEVTANPKPQTLEKIGLSTALTLKPKT